MTAIREASGTARLKQVFGEAGIGSSAALGVYLSALYGRDGDRFSHAWRVASMSVLVASSLGIGDPLLGHIERAALLHDLGALLTQEPGSRMTHPVESDDRGRSQTAAHDILVSVPFLAPAAGIVRAVRERYDGTGHPRGLRGLTIPLGARVVAIAETFDRLVFTHGPTHLGTIGLANARLVSEAGTAFDPRLVRAWLRALDGLGAHRVRHFVQPNTAAHPTAALRVGTSKRRVQCS